MYVNQIWNDIDEYVIHVCFLNGLMCVFGVTWRCCHAKILITFEDFLSVEFWWPLRPARNA